MAKSDCGKPARTGWTPEYEKAWDRLHQKGNREYPCPKCKIGELYDANAGGMFCKQIRCDNPDCDYEGDSDICGCIGI